MDQHEIDDEQQNQKTSLKKKPSNEDKKDFAEIDLFLKDFANASQLKKHLLGQKVKLDKLDKDNDKNKWALMIMDFFNIPQQFKRETQACIRLQRMYRVMNLLKIK